MKPATSNCQVKYDSVEKRRSYRLFNMTAYRFFSIKNVQAVTLSFFNRITFIWYLNVEAFSK